MTTLDSSLSSAVPDPRQSARLAGLRYIPDEMPGIRRRRSGKGFTYLGVDGKPVTDADERRRIAALVIPPAWKDVWICPRADGHLQATGRDARGRKQYRYHADWRAARDETKFGRMVAFGEALPRLRERIEHDLALPGLPRDKVLAAVVSLLESTLIRVGNEEYARENRSFGLTTLRNRHVDITGARLRFHFRGKSGKDHQVSIANRRVARVVRACRDLPGQELFQYLDESGQRLSLGSDDVNRYLREVTGEDFSAKDFRTWGGTVLALSALLDAAAGTSEREALRQVVDVVKRVAAQLGNRPAICRKYYVHPGVIDAFLAGTLRQALGLPPLPAENDGKADAANPANPTTPANPANPTTPGADELPCAVARLADLGEVEAQALALLRTLPGGEPPRRKRQRRPKEKGRPARR